MSTFFLSATLLLLHFNLSGDNSWSGGHFCSVILSLFTIQEDLLGFSQITIFTVISV